jgi:hypothetical protein
MGRKRIDPQEKEANHREAMRKYQQSEKGKQATKKANEKYQQTDKYKEYRKELYNDQKDN